MQKCVIVCLLKFIHSKNSLMYNQFATNSTQGVITMNMINVDSSAIQSIGYDAQTKVMQVKFHKNPKTYNFCNVPPHIFNSFLNAPSKGTFYDTYIKGNYQCPGY